MFIVVSMWSCKDFYMDSMYEISLNNNTSDTICSLCIYGDYYRFQSVDTLDKDSSIYEVSIIPANSSGLVVGISDVDSKFLKSNDTITVFILDKKEYESKIWSQLADSAPFRQVYHLSGDDIRLLKRKVPYPPSEAMRNMDMVPSYEEAVR